MAESQAIVRPMRLDDLAAVHAVQCAAYPARYHEAEQVLASRWGASAGTCFVAERAGAVSAYLLAYAWAGAPPPLHAEHVIPSSCDPLYDYPYDYLFLHDLAVHPIARGHRLADALLAALERGASDAALPVLRLVAVEEATRFWAGRGFEPMPLATLDASYGRAVLMTKALSKI